jgi:hypothetical protein
MRSRYDGLATGKLDGKSATRSVPAEKHGRRRPKWLHEINMDGYRMYARLYRGAVRL